MKSVKLIILLIFSLLARSSWAVSEYYTFTESQEDTIIITLGKDSKIMVFVKAEDREKIRKLDWNAILRKAMQHLDTADRAKSNIEMTEDGIRYEILNGKPQYVQEIAKDTTENLHQKFQWKNRGSGNFYLNIGGNSGNNSNTSRLLWKWNLDLGLNNYLHIQNTPANINYGLDPFNSRYVAIQTSLLKRFGRNVALSWGLEYNWYNFMFDKRVRLNEGREGIGFEETNLNVKKSKLVVMYLSLPVMLKFRVAENIQFGLGGQIGYRMGSYSKFQYEDAAGKEITDRYWETYHLNDFRYGLRAELGFAKNSRWTGTKIFFNYDMNPLFKGTQSPELQAISFGLRL